MDQDNNLCSSTYTQLQQQALVFDMICVVRYISHSLALFDELLDYVCLVPRVFLPVFLAIVVVFVLLFAIEAVVHLTLFDVDVGILINCCSLFGGQFSHFYQPRTASIQTARRQRMLQIMIIIPDHFEQVVNILEKLYSTPLHKMNQNFNISFVLSLSSNFWTQRQNKRYIKCTICSDINQYLDYHLFKMVWYYYHYLQHALPSCRLNRSSSWLIKMRKLPTKQRATIDQNPYIYIKQCEMNNCFDRKQQNKNDDDCKKHWKKHSWNQADVVQKLIKQCKRVGYISHYTYHVKDQCLLLQLSIS
ncbi:Hypothetical_protein [Hexamita inflata]|uniref:Hypothetical_protein n=1 Tax=Hexamita inflata TaxID=28002 RepID=A0ABP1HHA7_9EUKA